MLLAVAWSSTARARPPRLVSAPASHRGWSSCRLLRSLQLRFGHLRQGQAPVQVPIAHAYRLAAGVKLLKAVFAHRLHHAGSRLVVPRIAPLHHKALGDQRLQPIQRIALQRQPRARGGAHAHALHGIQHTAAGKHRQTAKQRLLVGMQQFVAPIEGPAQRLLALEQIGRAPGTSGPRRRWSEPAIL